MSEIVKILLESQAIHINTNNLFTWASGIKSPIYCDNRKLISHPSLRRLVVDEYCKLIEEQYPTVEVIAGTATAGIPWACWIADKLDLPMIYIRSNSKSHGLTNAIEGELQINKKVLIIEDLISTGKSSIDASKKVIEANGEVQGVVSIFTYGLDKAKQNFKMAEIKHKSLTNLSHLLEYSLVNSLLTKDEIIYVKKFISDKLS